ncbi:hypothetical protein M407DRAFT_17188 [Tulasnella calospora MUT 4182]|uniref:F-box domain-containing protein n=1 Tax=Tulasnella calospora MUT 4182 TaxID=1051891 RepID=A0A0C3QM24_9AGAM|nr:hypothetical protein M407DRAFT_17188 [Tulasnella calospora MUT 4182]
MVRSNSQTWLEKIAARSRPSRWIALEYDCQQYFSLLQRIIESATDLQHLAIALDSGNSGSSETIITNLTKLRTLHLRSFNIPWGTLDSLRLESLWLECPSPCPTKDQILSVFCSSPCLRRLVFRNFYAGGEFFSWSPQEALPEPQDSSPIDLPRLEILIIGSVSSSLSHPLLWRLRVPSCKILHLDNCHSTQFGAASGSELPKTIGRILAAAKQIRLTYTAQNIDGSGRLEIRTLDPPYLTPTLPFRVTECSGLTISVVTQRFDAWNDLAEAIGLKGFAGPTALVVGSSPLSPQDLKRIPRQYPSFDGLRRTCGNR